MTDSTRAAEVGEMIAESDDSIWFPAEGGEQVTDRAAEGLPPILLD